MSTVEAIEHAVAHLPAADLAEFRRWFAEFDAAAWDEQIETDAHAGRLDVWVDEVLTEYRTDKPREFLRHVGCGEV